MFTEAFNISSYYNIEICSLTKFHLKFSCHFIELNAIIM